MHTVIQFLYWPAILLVLYGIDRWNMRPAACARWAALSLRGKIVRQIRRLRTASTLQAGLLAAFAGLYAAGNLSFGGWLTGTIASGLYLALHLYLLRNTLAARRAYDALGPLAYLAEARHAFGDTAPGKSDRSEDGVMNGLAWHTQPGEPCEACRLNRVHYATCACGHCPPRIPRGTVLHVSLTDRLAAKMPEIFGGTS